MKRADPDAKPAAPFSRPYLADSVRDGGDFVKIAATEAECAGLALLLRVVAVRGLSADMKVTRSGRYGVRVTGEVRAHVTQTCVVSLEPFEVACREEIDIRFAPEADSAKAHAKAAAEMKAAIESGAALAVGEDPPDPIIDGKVDLGAVAGEFLGLGLDPYPRRPGAVFAPLSDEPAPLPDRVSPFAILQKRGEKPK